MSTRAMVFIDGTWLAVTTNRLADQHGLMGRTGGPLDFGALPRVCAQEVAAQMALSTGIDVVRTHYFGSIATIGTKSIVSKPITAAIVCAAPR